jgi:hypothetical protein
VIAPPLNRLDAINNALAESKKQLLSLGHQKERMLHENRLQFFQPHFHQMEFFKQAGIKRKAVFSGNRWGKSTAGIIESICWCIGYRPFFEEGNEFRTKGIPDHGVKGLIIGADWDKVEEIFTAEGKSDAAADDETIGKLWKYLPKWAIDGKPHRTQKGVIDRVNIISKIGDRIRRSVLYFDTVKSFKNSGLSMESSDWDFIHLDEPVPEDLWKAASRGLIDRNGSSWWLLTPLSELWMYNEMVEKAESGSKNHWYSVREMDDNPLLTKEAKELYLEGLTEEERQCREKGVPLALGRMVYGNFNKSEHEIVGVPFGWRKEMVAVDTDEGNFIFEIIKPPYDQYVVCYAIDPHPQTPHAVIFLAISQSHIIVWGEIFKKVRMKTLSAIIKAYVEGTRLTYTLCDSLAWQEDPETGRCLLDSMHDAGLDPTKATKAKSSGIIDTRDMIGGSKGKKFRVLSGCRETLREFSIYAFDKDDKPVDKDDHMMENLYRLVLHDNCDFHPPVVYKPLGASENWESPSYNFPKSLEEAGVV